MKDNRKLWVVEVFLRTAWQPFRYFETRAEARTELTEQRRIRLVRVVQYIPKRRKVK